MGMTLDELLDATGINDLAGHEKKASAGPTRPDFLKLAERCRRAAEAIPAPSPNRDLVEKTAEIAVISRTLSEIDEIVGDGATKTANQDSPDKIAAFINCALGEGYSSESIAEFCKMANIFQGSKAALLTLIEGARSSHGVQKAEDLIRSAGRVGAAGKRRGEAILRRAATEWTPQQQENLIRTLRAKQGDKRTAMMLRDSGASLWHTREGRALRPIVQPPTIAELAAGGKKIGLTPAQLRKAVPIAGGVAAGAALPRVIGGGGNSDSRGGVVVGK